MVNATLVTLSSPTSTSQAVFQSPPSVTLTLHLPGAMLFATRAPKRQCTRCWSSSASSGGTFANVSLVVCGCRDASDGVNVQASFALQPPTTGPLPTAQSTEPKIAPFWSGCPVELPPHPAAIRANAETTRPAAG